MRVILSNLLQASRETASNLGGSLACAAPLSWTICFANSVNKQYLQFQKAFTGLTWSPLFSQYQVSALFCCSSLPLSKIKCSKFSNKFMNRLSAICSPKPIDHWSLATPGWPWRGDLWSFQVSLLPGTVVVCVKGSSAWVNWGESSWMSCWRWLCAKS